jgi:hypothetical protein
VSRVETEQRPPPPVVGARVAQAVSEGLQFVVAAGIASLCAYGIWNELPEQLDVRTDIVGYPIFNNFNPSRYFWLYWLIIGFVPLVTLPLFLVLRKLVPRMDRPQGVRAQRRPAVEPPPVPASGFEVVTVGVARVLFVGAIFALVTAFAVSQDRDWILPIGVPVTAGYAVLAVLAALALGRVKRLRATFWGRLALLNAVAVPFCVGSLYAVSRETEVTILANGEIRKYSWFPLWLAVGLTAVALAWVARGAILAHGVHDLRVLERRLLLVVAGPVLLLLFVAVLPGARGGVDMFHEGELLAGARLLEDGAFPWRDFIFIHGLLTDGVFQAIGFKVFEDSRWGYVAGTLIIIIPLYWISHYYLFAYLFHRNWLFLVGTQLALILGVLYDGALRFIFLPFVLVLMGALLSKASWARAAVFMTTLVAQTVLTPEAGLAALAVLVVVVAFEAYYYDRSKTIAENFRRTLMCAGVGAVLTLLWAVFLMAFGALDDFVFTYLTFASDHQLTGSLPVHWVSDRFRFAAVAPVVLVVLAFWFFALQILRRGPLRIADWVMGAAALFVALYYHKFLARADVHVFQILAVTIPLLYYAAYRLLGLIEDVARRVSARFWRRMPVRFVLTSVAVVILTVEAPFAFADVVRRAPTQLHATVSQEAQTPAVGFTDPEGIYDDLLKSVDRTLHAYLGPDDELFDFTNSPAFFHYFLDWWPATRYYHVSMAIRSDTQEDLIHELERTRPKLVVYSSSATGLGTWDEIPNQVRHYLISRYLLEHYRPLFSKDGFLFLARRDAELPPPAALAKRLGGLETKGLYFRTYSCVWGYAPNFLKAGPSDASSARPLVLTPHRLGRLLSVSGWAVDREAPGPAAKVVAAVNGRVVAQAVPTGDRPDIVESLGNDAFLSSAFSLSVPPGAVSQDRLRAVRVYALTHSGKATEVGHGSETAWGAGNLPKPAKLRLGKRLVPVVEGAAQGFADSSSLTSAVFAVDLPAGTRTSAYDWLEIETPSPMRKSGFNINDQLTMPERGISLKTLDRGERKIRVLAGACSQWHGYRSRRLYVISGSGADIKAVRLYR